MRYYIIVTTIEDCSVTRELFLRIPTCVLAHLYVTIGASGAFDRDGFWMDLLYNNLHSASLLCACIAICTQSLTQVFHVATC